MNTVDLSITRGASGPRIGDIYRSSGSEAFILARCDTDLYVAISLMDGDRWTDPKSIIGEAVRDLIFVGSGVRITVEDK